MAEITLPDGRTALVSDQDYEWLHPFNWKIQTGYAVARMDCGNGARRLVFMHRLILSMVRGDGKFVDHINGNRLDNRRENLRACTPGENVRNQKLSRRNTSGFKGVHWSKSSKKWRAGIRVEGKRKELGYFDSLEAGYAAYCKAAIEFHGEFARLK